MVLITRVTGAFVNQLITGGPHIVGKATIISWEKSLVSGEDFTNNTGSVEESSYPLVN